MKMSNLASIDETLDRKGMSNSSELDRAVWSKFFNSLVESAKFLPDVNKTETAQGFAEDAQARFENLNTSGENILRITNTRQGQNIFREMVLASYDEKCAITGISQPSLLIAGHIRPWSFDKENRMNPRNGICLNRLHDKAFENNLIAVEDDGRIVYSTALDPVTTNKMRLMSMTGYFNFPSKFRPDENFLREHRR